MIFINENMSKCHDILLKHFKNQKLSVKLTTFEQISTINIIHTYQKFPKAKENN